MSVRFIIGMAGVMLLTSTSPVFAERQAGMDEGLCPDVAQVEGLTTEDVWGTTFTGTYSGDSATLDGLTVEWDVDRVFAGGPVPKTLAFQTPTCRWVNLTPGVRYLFTATYPRSFRGVTADPTIRVPCLSSRQA